MVYGKLIRFATMLIITWVLFMCWLMSWYCQPLAESDGYAPPLFANTGLVICPNLYRNIEVGVEGWRGTVNVIEYRLRKDWSGNLHLRQSQIHFFLGDGRAPNSPPNSSVSGTSGFCVPSPHTFKHNSALPCCWQWDWQAVDCSTKDVLRSNTTVNGEQVVMTTLTMSMLQLHARVLAPG